MRDPRVPRSRRRRRRSAAKVVRVDRPPADFAVLFETASERGLRVGWLEMNGLESEKLAAAAGPLEEAAQLGVLRAVALGGGRAVSVKPVKGAWVLGDVLREHFSGCALVLVRSEHAVDPEGDWRLQPEDGAWVLARGDAAGAETRRLATDALLDRLRSPTW